MVMDVIINSLAVFALRLFVIIKKTIHQMDSACSLPSDFNRKEPSQERDSLTDGKIRHQSCLGSASHWLSPLTDQATISRLVMGPLALMVPQLTSQMVKNVLNFIPLKL